MLLLRAAACMHRHFCARPAAHRRAAASLRYSSICWAHCTNTVCPGANIAPPCPVPSLNHIHMSTLISLDSLDNNPACCSLVCVEQQVAHFFSCHAETPSLPGLPAAPPKRPASTHLSANPPAHCSNAFPWNRSACRPAILSHNATMHTSDPSLPSCPLPGMAFDRHL
jgi:hypothetical protein